MSETGNQPGDVGAGLSDRGARLEARHSPVAELSEEYRLSIEPVRQDERHIAIEEAERIRQDTDDLARLAVDHQRPAHGCGIASEPGSPVARGQHDGFGSARRVVRLGEHAPEHRLRAEHRQDGIRREERPHLFRLRETGDAHSAGVPQPKVLEYPAFLTVGEVQERRGARARDIDAGCGVVERDQLAGLRIGQRLQEDALDDAEYGCVGADPNRERHYRDGRKARHPGETAHDLLQSHAHPYGEIPRGVQSCRFPQRSRGSKLVAAACNHAHPAASLYALPVHNSHVRPLCVEFTLSLWS